MYKLEDRILFDGAAIADVVDAQQEAEAQQEAAQAAEAEEAAQQDTTDHNADDSSDGDESSTEAHDNDTLAEVLSEIHTGNLGSDGQRVDVLLVSSSLENADDIVNNASTDTIVVVYDARTASAADLIQQITTALDGKVADSIGFVTESGENAHVQLFADTDTSLDTVNDSIHQNFFSNLDSLLDEGGQVNLFASNLASTAEGEALVDAMSDAIGHDVAASTDETGSEAAGGDWDLEYSTNDSIVDVAETYLDENLVDNFSSLLEDHVNHEVAFINSSVMNVDEILNDLGDNVEIVMLEEGTDGLQQITDYLNENSDVKYDAVHILTHGNEGYFVLNGEVVDGNYVNDNAADFVQWRNALSDDADVMIYGCNLAGNQDGQSLVANIASLTGADVAASVDTVGDTDWSLDYNVGDINYGAFDIHGYNYHLADQLVTSLADDGAGVLLTLREAILAVGEGESITFDSTLSGGTITLAGSELSITRAMSISGLVSGGTNTITIDADNNSRIFNITTTDDVLIQNFNLINGSAANGGAISNASSLTLNHVNFTNNSAFINATGDVTAYGGAIYNTGDLTIIDSSFTSNSANAISGDGGTADALGGAIYNNGNFVSISSSTFTNNTATATTIGTANAAGGAIYNNAYLSVENESSISGNTADYGGGIYNDSDGKILFNKTTVLGNTANISGGGIYNRGGKIQAENLWVHGNAAQDGGGIYNEVYTDSTPETFVGDILLKNTTIDNNVAFSNGGAIYNQGILYGENLTIAANTADDGSAIYIDRQTTADQTSTVLYNATVALNTVSTAGHSAIYRTATGSDTFAIRNTILVGNGDITDIIHSNINDDTGLVSSNNFNSNGSALGMFVGNDLADNGGWVQTLALNTTNFWVSNFIVNNGLNDGPSIYDSRGYMRNGTRDIGAYEANAYVATNKDRGIYYTSIQAAINAANNGDTIELVGSRIIVDTEITIDNDIILLGQGAGVTVLDAIYGDASQNRIFYISNSSTTIYVRIDGLSLTGGRGEGTVSSGNGGAIYNTEDLLLKNVSIYNNNAATSGGALYNNGGFVYVERSDIYDNSAATGGAFYNEVGSFKINESTYQSNSATSGSGGAIYSHDDGSRAANVTITSSTFNDNWATVDGGAIYAEGVVEFTNSTFAFNSAVNGGALELSGSGNWKLTNVTIAYNTSSDAAGFALNVEDGTFFGINLLIANNIDGKNWSLGTALQNLYNVYLQDNGDLEDFTIFNSQILKDYGGWSKTLAITSTFSNARQGTNFGVPGYDQRGYETNGTRDIGAYEYDGYIGTVTFPNHDTSITVKISSLDQIDDYPEYKGGSVVTLVNTRILDYDISLNMWYLTGSDTTPRAARNITVYGHAAGGTVISAGNKGGLFTLVGNTNGASSPSAIMGTFTIERVTLSDAIGANGPVVTGLNNDNNVGGFVAREVTFKNNTALNNGGALYVAGWDKQLSYTVSNSTFENNIALGGGGAIYAAKPITVSLSTFAYNRSFSSGGAAYIASGGTLQLSQSTVAFNYTTGFGGGVYNAGTFNTSGGLNLLAKNRDSNSSGATFSGYDYYLATGGKLSAGVNNMVEYQNGMWVKDVTTDFYRTFDDDNNRLNFVGPHNYIFSTEYLSDNGGWTNTLELSEYSAALDPESSRSGVDQRGYEASNWRDIGATELNGTYVTLTSNGKKYSSIEDALVDATSGDTLTLNAVRITEHDIQISSDLTIVSSNTSGSSLVRGTHAFIDALGYGRVFFIGNPAASVSMTNLYLMNGISLIANTSGIQQAAGNGGAIYNAGTLTATHLSVIDSFAQVSGGAIYSSKSLSLTTNSNSVSLINVEFKNNSAGLYGGAIYASGTLSVSGNAINGDSIPYAGNNMYDFWYNSAKSGGAIYTTNASDAGTTPAFKGIYARGNSSFSDGGALYIDGGNGITIAQSYFLYNSSMSKGGVIYQKGSDLTIWDSAISRNFAFSDGGAVYFDGGYTASMTVYASTEGTNKYASFDNNYSLSGDGGAIHMTYAKDLDIYAETILHELSFTSNHANDGDGGAIYFTNSDNINIGRTGESNNSVHFILNTAYTSGTEGRGGAIYMSNSLDLTVFLNTTFGDNISGEDGGAIYVINSRNISFSEHITIRNNVSNNGSGGGVYLENVQDITFNYVELADNASFSNGGGIYIANSGDITLIDVDAYDNLAFTGLGGALYITDSVASDLTIKSSSFYRNVAATRGGGVYVATAAADVLLENTSFAYNDDTAFYLTGSDTVTIKYSTFAYNTGTSSGVSGIYIGSGALSISNSIIYETGTPFTGSFTITASHHNVFYSFGSFTGSALGLSAGATTTITAYTEGGGIGGSAIALDDNSNIVGATLSADTFIINNLYLSTEMFYHANYLTRALALESRDSIAYHYMVGGVEQRAGTSDIEVNYDQRGNLRSGVEIDRIYYEYEDGSWYKVAIRTDNTQVSREESTLTAALASGTVTQSNVDGVLHYTYFTKGANWQRVVLNSETEGVVTTTTVAQVEVDYEVNYVYFKYGTLNAENTWMKVTITEDGSATFAKYTGTVYTSIGAFEPNFYMTVTSNGDNTSNPDFVVHSAGTVWHDLDVALTFGGNGVTLRESIFWIDSYKLGSTNNSSSDFSEDGDRYVQFADNMFNNGNTTITLDSNAEYISIRNDVIIGMVDNYTDGVNTYNFFKADNTFTGQEDGNTSRITISGGGHSRVFAIFSKADYSNESGNWTYSAKVGLNNLTIANGLEDGSGQRYGDADGLGGGIYNEGTLTLHNTLVKDSEASNVNISTTYNKNRSNTGQGGGIYNINTNNDSRSGYLYIYDSTLDNNTARGTKENDDTVHVAYGGGIYVSNGNVYITRSSISSNETYGFGAPEPSKMKLTSRGGGLYMNSGTVNVEASTITDNAVRISTSGFSSTFGDAICQINGSLTLTSNTVAYNRVRRFSNGEGVAVYLWGGSSVLRNNIFANNYVDGLTEQIGRDISAYNSVTDTYNIIGNFSGHDFAAGTGNILGDNASGRVDQLYISNELKYNGGMTKNYRLGANSVAINAGNAATVTAYDQRGLVRATDGAGGHSIGSYELLKVITAYTNVADEALTSGDIKYDYSYVADSSASSSGRFGWTTNLRNALYLADQGATATINVADGITQIDLAEGAGALQIFNDITVVSSGGQITIDASKGGGSTLVDGEVTYLTSRAIIIDASTFEVPSSTATDVTIRGFDFQNTGTSSGNGGTIYSRGHLTLHNVGISDFYASGDGGALYLTGGNLKVNTVTITHTGTENSADGNGGAIYIESGSIIYGTETVGLSTVTYSEGLTISGTRAGGYGGGIYVNNAIQQFNLSDSTISNTYAGEGSGGGIYFTGQSMLLNQVSISGCSTTSTGAGGNGGGLYAEVSGTVTINGGTGESISNNSASNLGGGIFLSSGSLVMDGFMIQSNTAGAHGGGIYVINGGLRVTNSNILDNTSGVNGGGVYVAGSSNVSINSSAVGRNTAANYGGGVFINAPGFTSLNSTYSENTAGAYGGGLYFSNPGSMTLTYVTVANNISGTTSTTETDGGGIYINRGTLDMTNTIVAQNYTGSIDAANHNDLYFGAMGSVGTITYSIVGDTNQGAAINAQTGNIVYGLHASFMDWSALKLDTTMYNNGGDTLTVYVQSDSIAIGNGLVITGPPAVTDDQRGVTRSVGTAPDGPTIGAFEKTDPTEYFYVGGDVDSESSWNTAADGTGTTLASGGFSGSNNIYTFTNNGHAADFSSGTWTINERSVVNVAAGGAFMISGTAVVKAFQHRSPSTDTNMTISVKDNGSLTFNTDVAQSVNLSALESNSLVSYTYIGTQDVYTATYGNLTISGGSDKTAGGAITVNGDLSVNGSNLVLGGDLTTSGNVVLTNGTITGGTYNITGTGDLSGTGTNSITGNTINLASVSSYAGNIEGSGSVTISGVTDITGNITGADVTIDGGGNGISIVGNITSTTGDVAVYGDGSTISLGSVTTDGGNIYLGSSNADGTTDQATSVTIANSTISSTSGAIYLNAVTNTLGGNAILGSASNSDLTINGTLQSTAGTNTIYYGSEDSFTKAVTIDNSILNFNIGDHNATISGAPAPTSTLFNLNNFTVLNDGTLGVVTTGNIEIADVDTSALGNFDGTFSVTCDNISFTGTNSFVGGTMDFEFNNSGYFGMNDNLIFENSVTVGDVMLYGTSTVNATLTSVNGSVTVGNVTTDPGSTFNDGDPEVTTGNITLKAESSGANVTIGGTSGNINDVTLTADNTATVNGTIDITGNFTSDATTTAVTSNITTGGNVSISDDLNLGADITASAGSISVGGDIAITGDSSMSAVDLTITGDITGTGDLSLTATGSTPVSLGDITLSGELTLDGNFSSATVAVDALVNKGTLTPTDDITVSSGNLTNSGVITANDITVSSGNLINNGTLTATTGTVNVTGDLINTSTDTFTASVLEVGGNITNTGTMDVDTLNILGDSVLSLGGTVEDFTLITLADGKNAQLTNGNITTGSFNFLGTNSTFTLGSGTSMTVVNGVNGIDYNTTGYDTNYFVTTGTEQLIRTMDGTNYLEYRIKNISSTDVIVVSLKADAGEKIAVHIEDSVKLNGEVITGIQDTVRFTTHLDHINGTSAIDIGLKINWDSGIEGSNFTPGPDKSLETLESGWSQLCPVDVDLNTGRSSINCDITHNGTYTVANAGADMTTPPIPPNPTNVNIYEMANSHFLSFNDNLDTNIFLPFEVGVYPYFKPDTYATTESLDQLGRAIYRQMEYRFVTDPQTNPLYGQVPPIGAETGQAITEQASLTLTGDAPVYVVADGEYSAGDGWLPITEPASVENIEEYQEPITQGQINEFYLEFGGREDIFTRPASFKSDLDAMLDDLLAG